MLWRDIATTKPDDIVNEFNEDVQDALDTYCKHTMTQLNSFGKRKLRFNVLSTILTEKSQIQSPVITAKGQIISFDKVPESTQFYKCQFVQYLLKQLPKN